MADSGSGQGKCSMSLKRLIVLESKEVLRDRTKGESVPEGRRVSWKEPSVARAETTGTIK